MKKIILLFVFAFCTLAISAQEFTVITVVESIVPAGIGRSRMISNKADVNYNDFTTTRTQGTDTNQGKVRRRDAKVNDLEETKLLNFYSLTGINFQNIASNDAIISSKLNEMSENGWELAFVTSGVESDAGAQDQSGIFVTRFIFKRNP